MRIQRQCHALADELNALVNTDLVNHVMQYCADRKSKEPYKNPDSELHVDEHGNILLVGGSLSGDCSRTEMCMICEGVDVEIGEGSIVIGCTFSRLELISVLDSDVKELNARHTVKIGKNCVLIGCLLRDDCEIGDGATMAASAVSQAVIGKDCRIFLSSVLLRYGSVGTGFTAVHTLFHSDKCKVGANAFMMSGKYGIIPWESATKELYNEITTRCDWITYSTAIQNILNDCFMHGLQYYDNQKEIQELAKKDPDDVSYKYQPGPTAYRKQYLYLDKLARMMKLTNSVVCLHSKTAALDHCVFKPMIVLLRDRITRSDADCEMNDFNGHEYTYREMFSYEPRIRVGDNVQFYWSLPLCVTRIEQETYASWRQQRRKPCGYDSFTWNKFNGYDYDLEIGDDCVITSCADWLDVKTLPHYERAGRFIMKDGVTLYIPTDRDGDPTIIDSLNSVDIVADTSRSLRLSSRVEYIFEDNTKIFMRQAVNWESKSNSYVWRIKVKPNEMAVI